MARPSAFLPQQQAYTFDLHHEVARFYDAHPERKQDVYVIDVLNRSLTCPDDMSRMTINWTLKKNPHVEAVTASAIRNSTSHVVPYNGYDCMFINTSPKRLLEHAAPADIEKAFMLDHETGHIVCPKGKTEGNLGECVADAYAAIRHIQRFGAGSQAVDDLVDIRAAGLVFSHNNGSHFTSPVVQQILNDRSSRDFGALTPQDTIRAAETYAEKFAPKPQALQKLVAAFSGYHDPSGPRQLLEMAKGDLTSLRKLGDEVLAMPPGEARRWGRVAALALLDGKMSTSIRILPEVAGWKTLRRNLVADKQVQPKPVKSAARPA